MIIESTISHPSLRGALPRSNLYRTDMDRHASTLAMTEDGSPRYEAGSPHSVRNNSLPKILMTMAGFAGVSLLFFFVIAPNFRPTGSLLSPLPEGEIAAAPTTIPLPTLSFAESLNLAQNYLSKAYELARNQNQNDLDKKAILTSLNQSLKQVDGGIKLDPKNPQGYLLRAQILTAISKINKKALDLARQDFDTASRLSQNQNVTLPPAINPFELLPDEQAAVVASGPLIAAPAVDDPQSTVQETTSSNASEGQIVLPAGTTELKIENDKIKETSYIYLIPVQKANNPVYVKSKTGGSFTLTTTSANDADLTINYYVINE